ncbi:MAG: PAS domain-containing protein [Rubrivivax sp.]
MSTVSNREGSRGAEVRRAEEAQDARDAQDARETEELAEAAELAKVAELAKAAEAPQARLHAQFQQEALGALATGAGPAPLSVPAHGPPVRPSADLDGALALQRALRASRIGFLDFRWPATPLRFSPECLDVLGYPPEFMDALMRGWVPLIHPDDLPLFRLNRQKAISGAADRFEGEIRCMRADGRYGWVRCVAEVVERDIAGSATRLVATLEDVDARRRAQDELHMAHQEIQALSAHVETHLEAKRKLIAAEVHDQCGQVLTLLKMELAALRAATRQAAALHDPGLDSPQRSSQETAGPLPRLLAPPRGAGPGAARPLGVHKL